MNAFQKQLLLKDNRSMAELDNPERGGIGQPLSPSKVSVKEFEERCEDHKGPHYQHLQTLRRKVFRVLVRRMLTVDYQRPTKFNHPPS